MAAAAAELAARLAAAAASAPAEEVAALAYAAAIAAAEAAKATAAAAEKAMGPDDPELIYRNFTIKVNVGGSNASPQWIVLPIDMCIHGC